MKAQILTATLFTTLSGALYAADPELLNLLAPDAKVVAGVNVEQAKGTQFGQYLLNQLQSHESEMQKLILLTGFDPRRDVREVLVSSDGNPQGRTGLAVAKGNFDVAKISAAAVAQGAVMETYGSVTIIEAPKNKVGGGNEGIAFLDQYTVAAGDIASVKGAIDRQKSPQPLPAALLVKINQWSNAQDAWGISAVAPASLLPVAAPKDLHGKDLHGAPPQVSPFINAGQNVLQAAGGFKLNANVVFTGEALCDTAQNAGTLSGMVQLVVNLGLMQAKDAQAQTLLKTVSVTLNGNVVKVSATLPQDVFQQLVAPAHNAAAVEVHGRK